MGLSRARNGWKNQKRKKEFDAYLNSIVVLRESDCVGITMKTKYSYAK